MSPRSAATRRAAWRVASALAVLLGAGCSAPPPSSYVDGGAGAGSARALGTDSAGEACSAIGGGSARTEIFCGGWTQAAANVTPGGPAPADLTQAGAGGLAALASGGAWRAGIDQRFACAAPQPTTILDGVPAMLLRCTRRIGGWPQLALVAAARGQVYFADGIAPSLPVMERAIGLDSGLLSAPTAPLPISEADRLEAAQLASHAFTAKDAADYQRLSALGTRANLAEDFAAAETADRAALALQQRLLGADSPETANALMHLALQISDQGRFPEADGLFARAALLAPRAADRTAPPRLLHYEGLDALNQGHDARALALLARAGAGYAALLPAGTLTRGRAPEASGTLAAALTAGSLVASPTEQTATMGLIETWRYRAVVLRREHKLAQAEAASERARLLALNAGMEVPLVTARLVRTAAITDEAQGRLGAAGSGLARAATSFGQVLPETRPVAETRLLQAADALRAGDPARAARLCRSGTKLLRLLQAGARPELLAPCLDAFAALAARDPAQGPALRAAMFETAEYGQDSVTSRQIAEAAARLAVHARDPRVAAAIRRRQDASARLDTLYRQRDALSRGPASGIAASAKLPRTVATVDAAIAAAQAELAEADAAVQEAAPNFRQLVQLVVPAKAVLDALAPREAFVAVDLTRRGGWVFLLRDGQVSAARVRIGTAAATRLVRRIRASIEPNDAGHLPAYDTADAALLYRDVLGPVAAGLHGASALVVAPSGALLALPFEVLLTGPAQADNLGAAPWLVRQMPISYVPAAANFVALRKLAGGSHAPGAWFGFGDPRPVQLAQAEQTYPASACADSARLFAGLPTLPFSVRELTAARELLGGAARDQLLGPKFTAQAVDHVDLKRFRVLHFATHAILPSELRCQSQPAIVTSDPAGAKSASGALLTANRVLGLDLDANTVILSACNSGGIGGRPAGESLSALARAFFFAGARSMLVTHWSISDQASAYLIAETLRRYAAGADGGLGGALRAAQLGMIDGAGKALPESLAHPFFWAPFVLVGEGRIGAGQRQVAGR